MTSKEAVEQAMGGIGARAAHSGVLAHEESASQTRSPDLGTAVTTPGSGSRGPNKSPHAIYKVGDGLLDNSVDYTRPTSMHQPVEVDLARPAEA